jgi:hypothetical protein
MSTSSDEEKTKRAKLQLEQYQKQKEQNDAMLAYAQIKHDKFVQKMGAGRQDPYWGMVTRPSSDASMRSDFNIANVHLPSLSLFEVRNRLFRSLISMESFKLSDPKKVAAYMDTNSWFDHDYDKRSCPFGRNCVAVIKPLNPDNAGVPPAKKTEGYWLQYLHMAAFHIKWPHVGVYTPEAMEIQGQDITRWDAETLIDPCFGLEDEYIQANRIGIAEHLPRRG